MKPRPLEPKAARGARRSTAALLAALGLLTARPAGATGMQGHIFMAQCAAEQATDPRIRALVAAHPKSLVNGAFFPDSGYTAADHDQGEVAHWEQYIEAYIQLARERYKDPLADPAAAPHVAFMMGAAAHGITDSTFDTLIYERSEQIDRSDMDAFDLSMDVFLVADKPRYFIPEYAYDADTLSAVFGRVPHPVPAANITKAMETARSGIGALTQFLSKSADSYGKKYPWARAHVFEARTPGGYPFGAKVALRYYEEILRRLSGDTSADRVLIGSYPDAEYPLVTLDPSRADGRAVLFFGTGLAEASINESSVVLRDASGSVVPASVSPFRGDKWKNVITVRPKARWSPATRYTITLTRELRTLYGTSPSADIELAFQTCTPSASGDCAEPTGPAPASRCPITETEHSAPPAPKDDTPSEEAAAPAGPVTKALGPSCTASPGSHSLPSALAALLALPVLVGLRRRPRRPHR